MAAAFALLLLLAIVDRTSDLRAIGAERNIRIAVVYTPGGGQLGKQIRAAYAESLLEQGLPYDWVASTDLALFDGKQLARSYAAIVFPDSIDRRVSEDAIAALTSFAALGGSVVVIGDAGSQTEDGTYRPASLFAKISGVDDFLYHSLRGNAFGSGEMHFSTLAAIARWDIPSGKIVAGDLSSYIYGPLDYSYAKADVVSRGVRVDADDGRSPIISVRPVRLGRVAFIGLPVGYLRTHSDAFPMMMLTSYLLTFADVPHLVAAPDGVGRFIIDMHIDSSNEFLGIPNLRRSGLLRHAVRMEFDVTAGPDLNRQGDGLGFDACGGGRAFLQTLMPFGRIGSHGGWAHNEFAARVAAGTYTRAQIRSLILRNDVCLESVTGVPVRSFAAPVGVHPQPLMTEVLDSLGLIGYYYTGDTGAPVERPFYNGKLVSSKSWAFPIMPFGRSASVAEMRRAHVAPARVEAWLEQTAEYAADRHGVYLIYSHSYDFLYGGYAQAMSHFLDHLEAMQRAGRIQTTDMPTAAAFMNRFIRTTASFAHARGGIHVHLHNDQGLRSIAFAVPTSWLRHQAPPKGLHATGIEGHDTVLCVDDNRQDLDLMLPGAASS